MEAIKKPHVVFIPFPAQSHIKCMLKLAKLFHHKGLHITFVNTESNHTRLARFGGLLDLDRAPGLQFKTVPDGLPLTSDNDHEPTQTIDQLSRYLATNFLSSFLDLVAGLDRPLSCIISDGFMTFAGTHDAAEKLGVPIILFWTLAACGFIGFYQAKVLIEQGLVPLKDESYLTNGYLDTLIDIPGMEGIRLGDLPEHVLGLKPKSSSLKFMVEAARVADNIPHMILHTFDELERQLIKEIRCMFPHVYTVGPLQLLLNPITSKQPETSNLNGYSLRKEEPECVRFLESKEPKSVVYVNFGSLAVMSLHDLLEFGWGLVNSNYYFLWIIRTNLVGDQSWSLPLEILEIVKSKGFIGSWCLQEEVLNHPSVGGFLTHGGWGSVIESLSAGVPMMCWPVSGDQRTNCRQMCEEWGVGVKIGRGVKREEVEKVVREVMDGDGGRRMRKKAMEWRKMAEMGTDSDGSSSLNIEKLINEINLF